jgi:hypothetical protein
MAAGYPLSKIRGQQSQQCFFSPPLKSRAIARLFDFYQVCLFDDEIRLERE